MLLVIFFNTNALAQVKPAQNPAIFADVPDLSMIRVDDTYYMSSTIMHMSPGVPIMKSKDLVNWEIVSYAYEILDNVDALNLNNGKNSYGRGSWASSIRYHNGTFYVSTFAQTTGKTYVYYTNDIEKGPWEGRVPYLVPVKWEDGWPVLGTDGKVPDYLELPESKGLIPGIVASDEFNRRKGEPALPLVCKWIKIYNHVKCPVGKAS